MKRRSAAVLMLLAYPFGLVIFLAGCMLVGALEFLRRMPGCRLEVVALLKLAFGRSLK